VVLCYVDLNELTLKVKHLDFILNMMADQWRFLLEYVTWLILEEITVDFECLIVSRLGGRELVM
jgi:hypothetical protein